ncbi:phosphatidylserine decarboxylase [Cavenderia fasciculata]|uniref:phosphatidylserine decarboxylase n=1 Tax=Cavenderia fasciculata TaxID=261658 RepID=F4Q6B5_CACFS|nr:phosphatidylserine decarboxylase [Cavenderia fasciculata]EGG16425.1 phosphatidylserine decarboxylase [Cavenderia fasciculata]|eukprot:XP_004354825.1 phosphatidylserine decarboxylase [Cavenderia fasciculata]
MAIIETNNVTNIISSSSSLSSPPIIISLKKSIIGNDNHNYYLKEKKKNQLLSFQKAIPLNQSFQNAIKIESLKIEMDDKKKTITKLGLLKTFVLFSSATAVGTIFYYKLKDSQTHMEYLKRIPFRFTSTIWGKCSNIILPISMRESVYKTYSTMFGVNLKEVEKPLVEYQSMADFFSRRLCPGCRDIDMKAPLVSPVDGKIIYFGKVNKDSLEQVKGLSYSLEQFLGESQSKQLAGKNLYHIGIYLSPGDYHGVHNPTDWIVENSYHFPGYLFPVGKMATRIIPGLFALNERVVVTGQWKYGFFSMTPVGASNVGSIVLDFDKDLSTNNPHQQQELDKKEFYQKSYQNLFNQKGSEFAFFRMGSTVIIIFELPDNTTFSFDHLKPNKSIKVGEKIGSILNK